MAANEFERGAECRQWDLHIHTPVSFHWHGKRFESDPNSPANACPWRIGILGCYWQLK